jgi:hypothetical protein
VSHTTRDAWRQLWGRGWSLVPLEPRGKRARVSWKAYQTERADANTVRDWLEAWPDANAGVITGRVSGICVLDVDGEQGEASLQGKEMPVTPYVVTAKGRHYYFAYPALAEGQRIITDAGVLPGLDSRGDGGYVVGPGSVHETGVIYEWGFAPDECGLAQPPQWWLDLVVAADEDPREAAPTYSVPARYDAEGEERARKYCLAALEGEVDKVRSSFDGEKHRRLLYSAVALGGFVPVLREHEIEAALYDAIRDRAKDRQGARKTIRDGIDYGARRPREIPEPTQRNTNGQRERHITEGEDEQPPFPDNAPDSYVPASPSPQPTQEQRGQWEPLALSDLQVSGEAVDWIWQGYAAPRLITSLTGLWKSGKTTLLGHLLRVLDGTQTEFVGQRVRGCKVLMVSEESPQQWAERRDELSLGDHVHVITKPFKAGSSKREWAAFVQHCAALVQEREYGLVVVDTLHNLWSVTDENDNAQIRDAMRHLNQITEHGAGLLLVAHPTKADAQPGKATRGGGAIGGFVDLLIEFHRLTPTDLEDTRRLLYGMGRGHETPQELVLDYDHTWGYTVVGSRGDAMREARQRTLKRVLPTEKPGATVQEILQQWPERVPRPARHTLANDLSYLAREGIEVLQTGQGTNHDPHRYYYCEGNGRWARE